MTLTFNRVELIGHVGNTPDVRFTPVGEAVTRFSLATHRPAGSGAEAQTDWHQIVCLGRLAEFTGQHVQKGRLLFVAGRLTYWAYEGRDGQTRRRADVFASEVILLDRPSTDPVDTGSGIPDDEDLRA